MRNETRLAKITKATLGREDHGIMTSSLTLSYSSQGSKLGSSVQGFGGYDLAGEYAFLWLSGVMDALGVREWDKVVGHYVYADIEDGLVRRITSVETGQTFDPTLWQDL